MQHGREITDLQPRTKFQAHSKYLTRCLVSPNVKHLATCSADKTIKIWNMESHSITLDKTLTGHQRWVWDMAFSADSAYLVSASSDHYARLWELQNGLTVKQYAGHSKGIVRTPCLSAFGLGLTFAQTVLYRFERLTLNWIYGCVPRVVSAERSLNACRTY